MRAWLNGLAAIAAVAILTPGADAGQQSWVAVGNGNGGSAVTWWHLERDGGTVVIDIDGRQQRVHCPPGRSVTVVQTARGGAMSGGTSAGSVTSSVTVGGGRASASTVLGGVGAGGDSRVTVTCR